MPFFLFFCRCSLSPLRGPLLCWLQPRHAGGPFFSLHGPSLPLRRTFSQSGRFDHADRQFHSFAVTWQSIEDGTGDVKELIPEMFCLPECLVNRDQFDLGRLQNGQPVDNVHLPPWATSYHHFVRLHRAALESEHVSRNLHHWIDLIFGYKQRGPAAEEALNVFYYTSYEGAVDPDSATTEAERAAQEGMIREFGQTPSQLLTTPHPPRMSRDQALRLNRGGGSGDSAVVLSSLFQRLSQLRTFVIARAAPAPLTLIAPRCGNNLRAWLMRGLAQRMVTISSVGHIGNHDWQPVPVKQRGLRHQDSDAGSASGVSSPTRPNRRPPRL